MIAPTELDVDRRMNPGGFEETELSYAVAEEDEDDKVRVNLRVVEFPLPFCLAKHTFSEVNHGTRIRRILLSG